MVFVWMRFFAVIWLCLLLRFIRMEVPSGYEPGFLCFVVYKTLYLG